MPHVEPARTEDVPGLGAFLIRAFDQAGAGAPGWTGATGEMIRHMAAPGFLAGLLAREGTQVLIAKEAQDIVGFAVLRRVGAEEAELAGIIVLESRTGAGVGTALVEAAIGSARALGVRRLTVKTEAANARAIAFYRRRGFGLAGHATEEVQGTPVDLVVLRMEWSP